MKNIEIQLKLELKLELNAMIECDEGLPASYLPSMSSPFFHGYRGNPLLTSSLTSSLYGAAPPPPGAAAAAAVASAASVTSFHNLLATLSAHRPAKMAPEMSAADFLSSLSLPAFAQLHSLPASGQPAQQPPLVPLAPLAPQQQQQQQQTTTTTTTTTTAASVAVTTTPPAPSSVSPPISNSGSSLPSGSPLLGHPEMDRRSSSIAALRMKAREHELRLEMMRKNGTDLIG